jgi:haloalkane dehalogenase
MRVHYLDEGSRDGRSALMLHGEPTWSYLYRGVIRELAAAGYRCIAPDYIGFGRSDKVVEEEWYVIERHVETVAHLIEELALRDIVLICQDWGGPIGLRQAVDMSDRFAALVVMNTWLHHGGYVYSDGIMRWHSAATDAKVFGGDMPAGRILNVAMQRPDHDLDAMRAAYDAPFPDTTYKAGLRRFPYCLPFDHPREGNAADQQRCYNALRSWTKPAHFIFGDKDVVFPPETARAWAAAMPRSTLDFIEGAGHFVQEDAPADLSTAILRRLLEDGV